MTVEIIDQARSVLQRARAPQALLDHAETVATFAARVCNELCALGVAVDAGRAIAGALVHDIGKVTIQDELTLGGSLHERAGLEYLTGVGFDPHSAMACLSHGDWRTHAATLELQVVALADRLWKGERDVDLELAFVAMAADRVGANRWAMQTELSSALDNIAAHAVLGGGRHDS